MLVLGGWGWGWGVKNHHFTSLCPSVLGGGVGGEGVKNHHFTLSNLRQQRTGASVYVRLRDPPPPPPPPLCPAPAPHRSCQPCWTDRSVSDRRDGDFLVDLGGSSPLMSLRLIKGFIPRWRLQSDERSDWRLDSRDNWLIMGRSLLAPPPPPPSSTCSGGGRACINGVAAAAWLPDGTS